MLGEGAWLDGRRLQLAEPPALEMALIATGFGYDARRRTRQAEILQVVLPLVRDVRRAGAASLDLCAVACGRVDGYYEQGLQPWDLAAGGLVAREAGAVVTGLRGAEAGAAMVVAGRPPLVAALLGLLEGLDADADPLAGELRASGDRVVLLREALQGLDLAEPDLGEVVVALGLGLLE